MPLTSPVALTLLQEIQSAFHQAADPEIAVGQAQYMKNNFPFLGLRKPVRERIQKMLFRAYPISSEAELWATVQALRMLDYREFHYAAHELAEYSVHLHSAQSFAAMEALAWQHQWWDSIDFIAPKLIGPLLARHSALVARMDDWIEDENFWIRRCAILYQLKYKSQTDEKRLFDYCRRRQHEREFFIRKAIGWALREYSKTNPQAVRDFIAAERANLSGLSLREASKYI